MLLCIVCRPSAVLVDRHCSTFVDFTSELCWLIVPLKSNVQSQWETNENENSSTVHINHCFTTVEILSYSTRTAVIEVGFIVMFYGWNSITIYLKPIRIIRCGIRRYFREIIFIECAIQYTDIKITNGRAPLRVKRMTFFFCTILFS